MQSLTPSFSAARMHFIPRHTPLCAPATHCQILRTFQVLLLVTIFLIGPFSLGQPKKSHERTRRESGRSRLSNEHDSAGDWSCQHRRAHSRTHHETLPVAGMCLHNPGRSLQEIVFVARMRGNGRNGLAIEMRVSYARAMKCEPRKRLSWRRSGSGVLPFGLESPMTPLFSDSSPASKPIRRNNSV